MIDRRCIARPQEGQRTTGLGSGSSAMPPRCGRASIQKVQSCRGKWGIVRRVAGEISRAKRLVQYARRKDIWGKVRIKRLNRCLCNYIELPHKICVVRENYVGRNAIPPYVGCGGRPRYDIILPLRHGTVNACLLPPPFCDRIRPVRLLPPFFKETS